MSVDHRKSEPPGSLFSWSRASMMAQPGATAVSETGMSPSALTGVIDRLH